MSGGLLQPSEHSFQRKSVWFSTSESSKLLLFLQQVSWLLSPAELIWTKQRHKQTYQVSGMNTGAGRWQQLQRIEFCFQNSLKHLHLPILFPLRNVDGSISV